MRGAGQHRPCNVHKDNLPAHVYGFGMANDLRKRVAGKNDIICALELALSASRCWLLLYATVYAVRGGTLLRMRRPHVGT